MCRCTSVWRCTARGGGGGRGGSRPLSSLCVARPVGPVGPVADGSRSWPRPGRAGRAEERVQALRGLCQVVGGGVEGEVYVAVATEAFEAQGDPVPVEG